MNTKNDSIAVTIEFLQQLFGDRYLLVFSWLSIARNCPKSTLPVMVLVSETNCTGKSTFLKWLTMLFRDVCIIGNRELKMRHNGNYITKFIIAVDEGFIDVDREEEKERLKQLLSNSGTGYWERSGFGVQRIEYPRKVVVCSNDPDAVAKITQRMFTGDNPLVFNLQPLPNVDPDIAQNLANEVPLFNAFLSFTAKPL